MNKRYIIKPELKRNLIMMSFQGPLICHALVTSEAHLVSCNIMIINVLSCLVLLHKRCISVNLFPRFFVGLRRICLCANALNFEYQHLFIACKIDCVAMKPK